MIANRAMPFSIEAARLNALAKLATERIGEITPAERGILSLSVSTTMINPGVETKDRPEVRAMFLRWLATDEDAANHIDPFGLRVWNATISSPLDLDFCRIPFNLGLVWCTFREEFSLRSAELLSLTLSNCALDRGITADNLTTHSNVFLINLVSKAEVRFLGARIGGDLDCGGATLTSDDHALSADRAKISNSVFLGQGFFASGQVRLSGAQIGGDLDCTGATFTSKGQAALNAESAEIAGNVNLRYGLSLPGTATLIGAKIGGSIDCANSTIGTLQCQGVQVGGDLIWIGIKSPDLAVLGLIGSRFAKIRDERASWPSKGRLHLEGFECQELILHDQSTAEMIADHRVASFLKLSAEDRIQWLERQPDSELLNQQPWMQVAKLLETSGDPDGAKRVIYEMRCQQARAEDPHSYLLSLPYYMLEEEPLGVLVPSALLWFVGFIIFRRAHAVNAMAPRDMDAFREFTKSGREPGHYVPFSPAAYALENLLPVGKLGQDEAWGPNRLYCRPRPEKRKWTRWLPSISYSRLALLRWTLILLGWALTLILGAAISERFKP